MDLMLLAMLLPWLLIGFGCWLGYQLVRQNGRILLRLEALEQSLERPGALEDEVEPDLPRGLPIGSAAPEFELPDLTGGRTSLAQLRGRRLLLVFFNPRCGFCLQMVPDLAALPTDGNGGRPVPVIISAGSAEETGKLMGEHGVHALVLVQEETNVAEAYKAMGTPMGYLIDEQGRIASELVPGAEPVLALASGATPAPVTNGNGHRPHRGNRSLSDSKLNRSGLTAGTPAPSFRLPRLDGGELSLEEYRGRRLLLVFSDARCGPCDVLAPKLEALSRTIPQVPVVMISRGDAATLQQKVSEHGLSFPIALQKQWEISREYAMFATPVAYLIDEEGRIAAEVAVGPEPILDLLAGAAAQPNGGRAARTRREVVPTG